VVLSFTVKTFAAAKDLVNFIERGYDSVLDAENTPGELNDGSYRVYVEMPRNKRVPEQIMEMLKGVGKLTGLETFKFRYYKSFHSEPATLEKLTELVPASKEDYEARISNQYLNNFSNFFGRSYVESVDMKNDNLVFYKKFQDPLQLKFVDFGTTYEMFKNNTGKIMMEQSDISQVLFFTRYIGANYNITKIDNRFILENDGHAVVVERV
jgi:hypothetical protein